MIVNCAARPRVGSNYHEHYLGTMDTSWPFPFQSMELIVAQLFEDQLFSDEVIFVQPVRELGERPSRSLKTPRVNRLIPDLRDPSSGGVSVSDRLCSDRDILGIESKAKASALELTGSITIQPGGLL